MLARMKFYSVRDTEFEKIKEGYTLLFAVDTRAGVVESIPSYFYTKEWHGDFLINIKDILNNIPKNESGYGSVLLIECDGKIDTKLLSIWIDEVMCKLFVNVAISIKECYGKDLQNLLQNKIFRRSANCYENCYVFEYGTEWYARILEQIKRDTDLYEMQENLYSSVHIFSSKYYENWVSDIAAEGGYYLYHMGEFKDKNNEYVPEQVYTGDMYKCLENAGVFLTGYTSKYEFILAIKCPDRMSLVAVRRLVHCVAYFLHKYNIYVIIACPGICTDRLERCIASYWYC